MPLYIGGLQQDPAGRESDLCVLYMDSDFRLFEVAGRLKWTLALELNKYFPEDDQNLPSLLVEEDRKDSSWPLYHEYVNILVDSDTQCEDVYRPYFYNCGSRPRC
jgi:hypothetical protein